MPVLLCSTWCSASLLYSYNRARDLTRPLKQVLHNTHCVKIPPENTQDGEDVGVPDLDSEDDSEAKSGSDDD